MARKFLTSNWQITLTAVLGLVAVIAVALLVTRPFGGGEPAPGRDEPGAYTKWYVRQALDRYEREGRLAALDYYNGGGGVDGEWYIFITDATTDRLVAHATIPSRVGGDIDSRVDVTGYPYGKALLAAPEDGAWVDYVFLNPAAGEGKRKHVWAVRRDDLIFASGWYESSYQAEPPTKAEPGAYTKAFVADAIWRYQGEGRQAVIDYYNSPRSIDGEWYVFISDDQGVLLSHAAIPENVGESLYGPLGTDSTGYDFGSEMAAAPESGKWVDYVYLNPATGEEGTKHSWVVRHDDLIFGAGWYEEGGS